MVAEAFGPRDVAAPPSRTSVIRAVVLNHETRFGIEEIRNPQELAGGGEDRPIADGRG